MQVQDEDRANYEVVVQRDQTESDDAIVKRALAILMGRLQDREVFASPASVKHYCQLRIGAREHEIFGVMFLDVQNRLIAFEEMFRGTLTQTSVYPREVVIAALKLQAAAVVFTHNHPSGSTVPSRADEVLTQTLKAALALVDVRVLDHVIVSRYESRSMAESGLI